MNPASGTADTISHYPLLELLGRRAMGEVWLADSRLPRRVAVGLLPHPVGANSEAVTLFGHA